MRIIFRNQPAHAHSLIYSFTHSRWRRPTHCTHVHCTVFLHIPRETHLQGQGAPKPHVGCQFPHIPPKPCPPKAKIGYQFAVTTFFVVSQQQTFFGVFQQHSSSSSNILHGYQVSRTFAKGSTSSSSSTLKISAKSSSLPSPPSAPASLLSSGFAFLPAGSSAAAFAAAFFLPLFFGTLLEAFPLL